MIHVECSYRVPRDFNYTAVLTTRYYTFQDERNEFGPALFLGKDYEVFDFGLEIDDTWSLLENDSH